MIVGAAGFAAADPLVSHLSGQPVTLTTFVSGTVVASGWALWPDADTQNSTLGHSMGLASEGATNMIGKLFGGHRHGTHSLFFCALTTGIAMFALAQHTLTRMPHHWVVTLGSLFGVVMAFTSLMLVLRILGRITGRQRLALALMFIVIGVALKPGTWWMPYAVGIGCLSHLLADWLTPEGIEPFWLPFGLGSSRRYSLPDLAAKVRLPVLGVLLRMLMIKGTKRNATPREIAWVTAIVAGSVLLCYPSLHAAAERRQAVLRTHAAAEARAQHF